MRPVCPQVKDSLFISGTARRNESLSGKRDKECTVYGVFEEWSIETHTNILKELSVNSKALEAAELENGNSVWKRVVVQGLHARQSDVFSPQCWWDKLPTDWISSTMSGIRFL